MTALRAAWFAASFIACACVDPGSRFDDFGRRVGTSPPDSGGPDGGCAVQPGAISGDYLLALSVSIAPTTPVVVLATLSTPGGDGGTSLVMDAQPLSATDRKSPVGSPIHAGPFAIDAEGHFEMALPGLTVTGAANPITAGLDIVADVTLSGSLCGDGAFYCGTVAGKVTAPIEIKDLSGSTFTLTRIASPGDIPTQPPINCAGDPSDPL